LLHSVYWRNENNKTYVGEEFSDLVFKELEDLKIMSDHRVRCVKKGFIAICRIQLTLISIFGEQNFKKTIAQNKETILKLIQRTSEALGGTALLCKALKITNGTYNNWKRIQNYYCPSSLTQLCFKRVPGQVSKQELKTMETIMKDKRYSHLPTSSVWGYTLKQWLVTMSRSSWYKYSLLLKLTEPRKPGKKPRPKISVRAELVNEIWHMDVSLFKTMHRPTYYIYTDVDNVSRKILAYGLSPKVSAETRLQSLRQAIEQEFDVSLQNQAVDLIVDGGTENNNKTIKGYIQRAHKDIRMKIALKEVHFSNSIAEGTFKIRKQSYFKYRDILSEAIEKEVDFFVQDYNEIRLHYEHGIFTPDEIHNRQELKKCKPALNKAKKHRLKANCEYRCIIGCQ
jgi:hypothetical protein